MSQIAIRAEGLSKKYHIGSLKNKDRTLQEVLAQAAMSPFRRVGGLLRGHAYAAADLTEEFWALRDVSFSLEEGETVAIVGGNGAGKSTLLKLLTRITEPTEGKAMIRGRVGSLLEVGTGFHPELTGRENVFLNGSILGMSKMEVARKFDEIVAFSEIEKFIDTPVKHYSSGMKVRLAFSVAAHLEPEIMFVDEVLAVGDAAFRKKCLQKVSDVASSGTTVLLVSHNAQQVTSICKRAIWLKNGELQADGPALETVSAYLSEAVGLGGQRVWGPDEPAGDDSIRMVSVRIRTESGEFTDTVDVRESFYIEAEVDVLKPGYGFALKYDLFTSDNLGAFSSIDTQNPTWEGKTWEPGRHTLRMKVPGNFFQLDTYVLTLVLWCYHPKKEMVYVKRDCIAVHIVDVGQGMTSSAGFVGGVWTGPIRPVMQWEMEQTHEVSAPASKMA